VASGLRTWQNPSMRRLVVLALVSAACGRSGLLDPGVGRETGEGASIGGSAGHGGSSGTGGMATGGVGGTSSGGINDGCINETFHGSANDCSHGLPLPCTPCIACNPLPSGNAGGCDAPDIAIFSWPGGGVSSSLRYPAGCTVYLPTENPDYPGGPQTCTCEAPFAVEPGPYWTCPFRSP